MEMMAALEKGIPQNWLLNPTDVAEIIWNPLPPEDNA
jgi:hypothetical protein